MPGWASGLQRCRGCREVEDSGLGALERASSSQAELRWCCRLGSGPYSHHQGHSQGQGQGPGVCVRGGTLGLVGRSQEEAQSQTPQDPAWDSRGNCESLGVWDPWGWGHPVASVSATRCELTCLQVSVSVCEPWWGPSV